MADPSEPRKTAIVTGASHGIGAGIVKAFAQRSFNVVANSRRVTKSAEAAASDHVALVDGDIGEPRHGRPDRRVSADSLPFDRRTGQ